MKKYTNKILIITAIILTLGTVIGYTIDFQTGYRSGRIKYEEKNLDSLEMVISEALNETDSDTTTVDSDRVTSVQNDSKTSSENQTQTYNQ